MKEIHPYSVLYLDDARHNVAFSFDYAVRALNLSLEEYLEKFLSFEYIDLIESGNPLYVVGMSGKELAREICGRRDEKFISLEYNPRLEYWIGWISSLYQWERNITYKNLFSKFTINLFKMAYPAYHEMNEKKIIEYMDEIIKGKSNE